MTPGPLVSRWNLYPGVSRGERRLSQVPELLLWIHAPHSDPGGVPALAIMRRELLPSAPRHGVGFPTP